MLASRLSDDPERQVLLIEAGPDYGTSLEDWPDDVLDASIHAPASHPWPYSCERSAGEERLNLPQARILGGSAAINACAWVRGSQADYDSWADLGNLGWSFNDLLPYFQRVEADPLAAESDLHGSDGLVPITRLDDRDRSILEQGFLEAAQEVGFEYLTDMNGSATQSPGVGITPRNVVDGVRIGPALSYIAAARDRSNLTILSDTLVDRVLFDGTRAVAIQTATGDIVSGDEIILAGGSYSSPAILMRSGVGPADHLDDLEIPIVQDLPGVGANLRDHPVSTVDRYVTSDAATPDGVHNVRCYAKARSRQMDDDIDLHLYCIEYFDPMLQRWAMRMPVSLMYARSHGSVRLVSRDPSEAPRIDHNYFGDPRDLEAICDGIELTRRMAADPSIADHVTLEPNGTAWRDRDELRDLVRATNGTTFHPSSTCKLGPASDPMAVVNQAGRVYGLENLRVADASIFPYGPRANLHFTVCAVAEKIADLVKAS